MDIATIFNPAASLSGTFNANFPQGAGKMLLINESQVNVSITWDSNKSYVPAGDRRFYCIHSSTTVVSWSQQSVLPGSNSNTPSQIVVETYAPGEQIVETYPAPLVRSTTVGNTVTTAGGAATELLNIGNNPLTPVFDVQTAGDASASTMTNDNVWSIGTATNPGTYSFQNGRFDLDGAGNMNLNNLVIQLLNGSFIQDTTNSAGALVLTAGVPTHLAAVTLLNNGSLTLGNASQESGTVNIDLAGIDKLGTAGDSALYQPFQGTFKLILQLWNGYNNGGTNVDWALPAAFISTAYFWVGETQGGTVTFVSAGVGRVCSVQNTVSSAGGTQNAGTNLKAWTNGMTRGGFDTIRLNFSSSATGLMVAIGI